MSEKIRTIRLYGWLGTRFGRVHRLAVANAGEAMHALGVLLPGFKAAVIASTDRGVAYAIFLGKQNINAEQLRHPTGRDDIRIAPVLRGSKRGGVLQTILGAVIFVVGAVMSFYGGAGVPLMQMGGAMMFGGVVQMLSPQPGGLSSKDSPDNGASYNFNGPVNTSAQGNPVPVLYGRLVVGSSVVSAGIYAEDQT